ncbi:toll/interleukin-1 receptor domain-containing protein [Lentzea sp. NPDC058450]|uniref:toll/interleukin-1 receptor domain-containing protein n=1 Tax=Lentzea sp. NPDC058450 TaxID=3346505 RepID=UPI00364B5F24
MIKVFISHSTSGETEDDPALQIREALYAHLGAAGYDPFLDLKDMRVAEEWTPQMHLALFRCHVAVFLLTARALKSPVVRRELIQALGSYHLLQTPLIVPVLIGGVTTADVRAEGFSDLLTLHAVHHRKHRTSPADEVSATVNEICALFPRMNHSADDPLGDRWSRLIEVELKNVDREVLEASGEKLGLDRTERDKLIIPMMGPRLLAVHLLTHGGHHEVVRALDEIRLGTTGQDRIKALVEYLRPAWIDRGQAARVLPPADQTDSFVVALNADHDEIGHDYLQTATCFRTADVKHREVGTATGEDAAEDLLANMEQTLGTLAWERQRPLPADFQLPSPERFVLIVSTKGMRLDVALTATRSLHARFPEVIVFLLTGDKQLDGKSVIELAPLAEGEEAKVIKHIRALEDLLAS